MNRHTTLTVEAYAFRTCICDDCGGDGLEPHEWSDGYRDTATCSSCGGEGETDASCSSCDAVTAINDDGECRQCAGVIAGWELAERSAFGMVRS